MKEWLHTKPPLHFTDSLQKLAQLITRLRVDLRQAIYSYIKYNFPKGKSRAQDYKSESIFKDILINF